MKSAAFVRARHEWAQNPRLRWGALVVLAIIATHVALGLVDDRKAVAADYAREAELYRRLDATARDRAWPARAQRAEAARAEQLEALPAVRGDGAARANLQAWLAQVAADSALQQPVISMEAVVDVAGHPDLRQAVGRLEGGVASLREAQPVLRAFAAGLPWVQVEQLQIEPATPVRVRAIVRAYYRLQSAGPQSTGRPSAGEEAPASSSRTSRAISAGNRPEPSQGSEAVP